MVLAPGFRKTVVFWVGWAVSEWVLPFEPFDNLLDSDIKRNLRKISNSLSVGSRTNLSSVSIVVVIIIHNVVSLHGPWLKATLSFIKHEEFKRMELTASETRGFPISTIIQRSTFLDQMACIIMLKLSSSDTLTGGEVAGF